MKKHWKIINFNVKEEGVGDYKIYVQNNFNYIKIHVLNH